MQESSLVKLPTPFSTVSSPHEIKLDNAMTISEIHGQTPMRGILARGAYIHPWTAVCRGLKGRRPSTS